MHGHHGVEVSIGGIFRCGHKSKKIVIKYIKVNGLY